ncbi:hypothetical protein [Phyllobacterium sp. OV277]|uniref:hypothetical protein n=1 Tax=Phyllobacterium sp. OV277 TaxID=1882772 RepID=UPI000B80B5FA|nr:hypothetical protein [Phyllobacterium sp. OV277]
MPSTLDLYLNSIKVFSGEVPAAPFDVTNLPLMDGGDDARIVMKDALGLLCHGRKQSQGKAVLSIPLALSSPPHLR